jgi:hypothetical protein
MEDLLNQGPAGGEWRHISVLTNISVSTRIFIPYGSSIAPLLLLSQHVLNCNAHKLVVESRSVVVLLVPLFASTNSQDLCRELLEVDLSWLSSGNAVSELMIFASTCKRVCLSMSAILPCVSYALASDCPCRYVDNVLLLTFHRTT